MLLGLATSERLERAIKAAPGGEAGSWRAASRYVAGRDRDEALARAQRLIVGGHGVSLDLFGEQERDVGRADRTASAYCELVATAPWGCAGVWLSVDLTHLALTADPSGTADRLELIARALEGGARVQVGAEDAGSAPAILACVLEVARRGVADRLGATLQANLPRSVHDADSLVNAGVHVRLVKGAYPSPDAHPYGEPTDIAYLRLAYGLAERRASWSMATHDGRLREALLLGLGPVAVEQLLGVRPDALDELAQRGVPTRVYVPYGPNWFRYWLRRLAESRGA